MPITSNINDYLISALSGFCNAAKQRFKRTPLTEQHCQIDSCLATHWLTIHRVMTSNPTQGFQYTLTKYLCNSLWPWNVSNAGRSRSSTVYISHSRSKWAVGPSRLHYASTQWRKIDWGLMGTFSTIRLYRTVEGSYYYPFNYRLLSQKYNQYIYTHYRLKILNNQVRTLLWYKHTYNEGLMFTQHRWHV